MMASAYPEHRAPIPTAGITFQCGLEESGSTASSFGLAGVADYGVYVIGATSLSQTLCEIDNIACVLTIPTANPTAVSLNAGQITDTQMRCGGFTNVPPGVAGVELGANAPNTIVTTGVLNTTVSGTAAAGKCQIPPFQLVILDTPPDATSSLCNNSNATVAGCTGYQGPFAAGRVYTQPVVNYGTVEIFGTILYAAPFYSPASGGPITKLGLEVLQTGTATMCAVGIYSAFSGMPTTLIADAGTVSITGTGAVTGTLSGPLGTVSGPAGLARRPCIFWPWAAVVRCMSRAPRRSPTAGSPPH